MTDTTEYESGMNMKKQHIYIASCDENGGIYHGILENGEIKLLGKTPMDRAMYMVTDGDRMHIILHSPFPGSDESGIVTCRINEDGALSAPAEPVSTKGRGGCHLCAAGGVLYAANYGSGSVVRIPDNPVIHSGHGIDADRQESAHCHCIQPSPDGKYLIVCDLGLDKIITYDLDMRKISEVSLPAGNGPRHTVFSDDGSFVYCACELSSTVSVFSYRDGILTFLSDVPTLPEDFRGRSYPAAIRYHDGCVFVSNRGHDSVSVFRADNMKPELCRCIPCGGSFPRDFDIFGEYIVCTNEKSGNTAVIGLNGENDTAPRIYENIPGALCVAGKIL